LLTHGYMACTHISVCVCVSAHAHAAKMQNVRSHWLVSQDGAIWWYETVQEVTFRRSVGNPRHQKALTQRCSILSQKTWIFCCQNVMNYIMFFKNNSLQLYFPWIEMLAITDWHTFAIYAAIYTTLICIFKAQIQLLLVYVTKHSPCIKEVKI